ncbi:MAG: insulinase family protein, partial [Alphaproteobacteria bacterium]|nr:insulinase family protein [Alphaproteobacteria bacterium]
MHVNLTALKNGLRVVTVERPQTETVCLGIWVNTGSACETADINGISHFVEHMDAGHQNRGRSPALPSPAWDALPGSSARWYSGRCRTRQAAPA